MPSTGLENHVTTIKRKRPKKTPHFEGPGRAAAQKEAGDLINRHTKEIDAQKFHTQSETRFHKTNEIFPALLSVKMIFALFRIL
jgi:hypothetical protein